MLCRVKVICNDSYEGPHALLGVTYKRETPQYINNLRLLAHRLELLLIGSKVIVNRALHLENAGRQL